MSAAVKATIVTFALVVICTAPLFVPPKIIGCVLAVLFVGLFWHAFYTIFKAWERE